MFDRYSIYSSPQNIQKVMGVEVSEEYQPSYNSVPTQLQPVITSENGAKLNFFRWGLMSKWSNNKMSISARSINLASEKAFQKNGYKKQIQTKRCIILMNGFYSWKQVSKKQRVPYYVFPTEMSILGVAGLWEEFEDIEGKSNQSFVSMTVLSSQVMAEFENEMPAILNPVASKLWLENEDLEEKKTLIKKITGEHPVLSSHPVSPSIADSNNNYKELIEPAPASDQLGNYTLFS